MAWGAEALVVEPPFVQRAGRRNGATGEAAGRSNWGTVGQMSVRWQRGEERWDSVWAI